MMNLNKKNLHWLYLAVALLCTVSLLLLSLTMSVAAEVAAEDQVFEAVEEDAAEDARSSEKLALFDLTGEDLSGDNLAYTLTHLNVMSYVILALALILLIVVIVVVIVIIKKLKDSFSYV